MAQTRPSGIPIVDLEQSPVSQEPATLDVRGRLNFLPRWRERVTWLRTGRRDDPKETEALMIFAEPGLILIRDWQTDGPRIQERYAALSTSVDPDALNAMRLIQDRYQMLRIPAAERASLGDGALAHLGLPLSRGSKSLIYVSLLPTEVRLLSQSYRDARLLESNEYINDLP